MKLSCSAAGGWRRGPRAHHRCGAATVEFAVLLPLILFVFLGSYDFARVFYFSQTLANCACTGAMHASQIHNDAKWAIPVTPALLLRLPSEQTGASAEQPATNEGPLANGADPGTPYTVQQPQEIWTTHPDDGIKYDDARMRKVFVTRSPQGYHYSKSVALAEADARSLLDNVPWSPEIQQDGATPGRPGLDDPGITIQTVTDANNNPAVRVTVSRVFPMIARFPALPEKLGLVRTTQMRIVPQSPAEGSTSSSQPVAP